MSRTLATGLATVWTLGIFVLIAVPPPDVPTGPDLPIDKVAHFGAFFLFAWLWMMASTSRLRWAWVLGTGLVYAVGTEFAQELLPVARHPDPFDAAANAGGVLVGVGGQMLWTRIRSAVSAPSPPSSPPS